MTDAERYLSTMTLRRWLSLSPTERAIATDAIMETTPSELTLGTLLGHGAVQLPFFVHQPTQLGFYLVFGDRFVMGATPALLAATEAEWGEGPRGNEWELDHWTYERDLALSGLRAQVPARVVDVPPYFLAESTITTRWAHRFGLAEVRKADEFNVRALEAIGRFGWRLPSEAEVALGGHLTRLAEVRFSSSELGTGWCQDTWHPDFTGAPPDARPWGTDATTERQRRSRAAFDPKQRRAQLRPASDLFSADVASSELARSARSSTEPWAPGPLPSTW